MKLRQILIIYLLLILAPVLSACNQSESTPGTAATFSPPASTAVTPALSGDEDAPAGPSTDPYVLLRRAMVEQQIKARKISDEATLRAVETVPRHEFVSPEYLSQAYADHPLPIGYGQTISQPFIVALMTELLDLQPGDRVLEIGTGSGYQAAVLAQISDDVYTIEIVPELAEQARKVFERLGYDQIEAKAADGYYGWDDYAPFDAIIVTAAPDHVPQPLVNQLADGGILVIPIGPPGGYQSLWIFEREGEVIKRYNWGGVRFVPFTRVEE